MYKYPSINQFRNAVKSVQYRARYIGCDKNNDPIYDETKELPVLDYQGTIKTHGTNAAIIITKDGYYCQSRSNIITIEKDNAGFAKFVADNNIAESICKPFDDKIVKVYGEWCGPGIQKGVAINQLDNKIFIIFSIQIDEEWQSEYTIKQLSKVESNRVYSVFDFPVYNIQIDFNKPEESIEELERLTKLVEDKCPIGEVFNIFGTGEGIVWKCQTKDWEEDRFWFKTKGEKHQSSKTKTLVPVDVERVANIKKLASTFITTSRLNQGMETLTFDRANLGSFLSWVSNDIIKEESDTINENGFTTKEVCSQAIKMARQWFFEKEKENIGV